MDLLSHHTPGAEILTALAAIDLKAIEQQVAWSWRVPEQVAHDAVHAAYDSTCDVILTGFGPTRHRLRSYLWTSISNLLSPRHRKSRPELPGDEYLESLPSREMPPGETLERREESILAAEYLQRACMESNPETGAATFDYMNLGIINCVLQGLTYDEIAVRFCLSRAAVGTRYKKTVERARAIAHQVAQGQPAKLIDIAAKKPIQLCIYPTTALVVELPGNARQAFFQKWLPTVHEMISHCTSQAYFADDHEPTYLICDDDSGAWSGNPADNDHSCLWPDDGVDVSPSDDWSIGTIRTFDLLLPSTQEIKSLGNELYDSAASVEISPSECAAAAALSLEALWLLHQADRLEPSANVIDIVEDACLCALKDAYDGLDPINITQMFEMMGLYTNVTVSESSIAFVDQLRIENRLSQWPKLEFRITY